MLLPAALLLLLHVPQSALGQTSRVDPSFIGSVVKSDRWNLKRGRGVVEELIGNVLYSREDRQLRSDWALYDHATKQMSARGDIRGYLRLEDGALIRARGEEGAYNTESYEGHLATAGLGRPMVLHVTPGARGRSVAWNPGDAGAWADSCARVKWGTPLDVCVNAGRVDWNADTYRAVLSGGVYYRSLKREGWAQTVTQDQVAKRLTLEGRRPVITASEATWDAALQADRVIYERSEKDSRRVRAAGRVHGWISFRDPEPENGRPGFRKPGLR